MCKREAVDLLLWPCGHESCQCCMESNQSLCPDPFCNPPSTNYVAEPKPTLFSGAVEEPKPTTNVILAPTHQQETIFLSFKNIFLSFALGSLLGFYSRGN